MKAFSVEKLNCINSLQYNLVFFPKEYNKQKKRLSFEKRSQYIKLSIKLKLLLLCQQLLVT